MATKTPRAPSAEAPGQLLPQYLEQLVDFTQAYFAKAMDLVSDEPDLQPTVRILSETATEATRQIAREFRTLYDESNDESRQLMERQLRLAGGLSIMTTANQSIALPGASSKLGLAWIGVIIHLIKKLLEIIFPHMPPWLKKLLDFLDELWEMLQSLLGGKAASALAHEMTMRWLTFQRMFAEVEAARKLDNTVKQMNEST
jgi:hypothetical protein